MRDPAYHWQYKTITSSQTAKVLGANGAKGDYLKELVITPITSSPGLVSIKDGSGADIQIYAGGTSQQVIPYIVPLGIQSVSGPWAVTTGANVWVMAVGYFT